MELKKVEEIKKLLNNAKKLSTMLERYQEVASRGSCDKHDLCFGGDHRFTIFKATVQLTGYTGYYGSSGCSTFDRVDEEIATQAIKTVLNRRMGEIFQEMASAIRERAVKMREQAQAEVDALQEMIGQLYD